MDFSRLTLIKLVELIITLACLYLHREYHEYRQHSDHRFDHVSLLATITFIGYSIILIVLLIAYLMKKPINKHIDIFLSVIAIPLFIATGTFIIRFWQTGIRASINTRTRDWDMWKGSLSIANGGLFFVDALLTFWS